MPALLLCLLGASGVVDRTGGLTQHASSPEASDGEGPTDQRTLILSAFPAEADATETALTHVRGLPTHITAEAAYTSVSIPKNLVVLGGIEVADPRLFPSFSAGGAIHRR